MATPTRRERRRAKAYFRRYAVVIDGPAGDALTETFVYAATHPDHVRKWFRNAVPAAGGDK